MTTADRIREQMQARGMSTKGLSDAAAIPYMTLSRRLADDSSMTMSELHRIAAALDTTALALFAGAAA